jgi:hypothetical protein
LEVAAGRYSQCFLPSNLEGLIDPFHTSPIGLVPKPSSDKFRMIQDLSFLHNDHQTPSVNLNINPNNFPMAWGMFDSTAELILSLPDGCLAATFDISAAYHMTPVKPNQQNSLCMFWNGRVYVDCMVMFGLSSSAGVFGSIADMLVAIYQAAGFGPLRKWVDNFFVIRLPHHFWTETDFISLTADIGIPWSLKKLRPLASVQRYIGFDWDLAARSVSLPSHKLVAIQHLLALWHSDTSRFMTKESVSLHGKLINVSCIFPLIQPFLCSLSYFASSFKSPKV